MQDTTGITLSGSHLGHEHSTCHQLSTDLHSGVLLFCKIQHIEHTTSNEENIRAAIEATIQDEKMGCELNRSIQVGSNITKYHLEFARLPKK